MPMLNENPGLFSSSKHSGLLSVTYSCLKALPKVVLDTKEPPGVLALRKS